MRTLRNLTALAALLMSACAPQDPGLETLVFGTVDGGAVAVDAMWAEATGQGEQWRLTLTGTTASETEWLRINVDLDVATILETPAGGEHVVSSETRFNLANMSVQSTAYLNQSPAIQQAWIEAGCQSCLSGGEIVQRLQGALVLDWAAADRLTGVLYLDATGGIPGWWGQPTVQAQFALPFDVAIAYEKVFVAPSVPTPEPEVIAEPAGTSDTTGTSGASSSSSGSSSEQSGGSSTMPSSQPAGFPASGKYPELTLLPGMGVNFSNGQVIAKAHFANSDLYATNGHNWLKLTPGGPNAVHGQPIRWFNTSSGFIQTFTGLDKVPHELPSDVDGSKSLVNAKPGVGFVVKNNLGGGYTRCWIRAAGPDSLTLEYEVVSGL